MKDLKKDLKSMAKEVKALETKLEKMIKSIDKTAKAKPAKKAAAKKAAKKTAAKKKSAKKAPAKKKAAQTTAYATVLGLIGRSKNGVDTTTLMKKTGYKAKKIADLIYKGKKRGEIKTVKKGVYVKG